MVTSFDEQGNKTEWQLFDKNGKPRAEDGYSIRKAEYDASGNRTRLAYFDASGKAVVNQFDGTHALKMTYDAEGFRILWKYFAVNDEPCLTKDGFFTETARYDSDGRLIESSYFGMDGRPILRRDGYQKRIVQYGTTDDLTTVTYLDIAGNPVSMRMGLKLTEVMSDGQAASVGLHVDDVIVSYENWRIPPAGKQQGIDAVREEFRKLLVAPGDKPRTLTILRGQQLMPFQVKPGLRDRKSTFRGSGSVAYGEITIQNCLRGGRFPLREGGCVRLSRRSADCPSIWRQVREDVRSNLIRRIRPEY